MEVIWFCYLYYFCHHLLYLPFPSHFPSHFFFSLVYNVSAFLKLPLDVLFYPAHFILAFNLRLHFISEVFLIFLKHSSLFSLWKKCQTLLFAPLFTCKNSLSTNFEISHFLCVFLLLKDKLLKDEIVNSLRTKL